MDEHITPSVRSSLLALRYHGFALELHERVDGGYGIVMPIDGNYFDLTEAYDQLDYWTSVVQNIDEKLGIDKRKYLYKDNGFTGDLA
jgi:hypothetical protein